MIKWPVKLYVRFFNVFLRFFQNPKKHDFLRFFELLHTFSRTVDSAENGKIGRCTTTLHQVHKCPRDIFGKFTSCMTFAAHKRVRSEPFLDYLYEFDDCCQRYIASCGKNFI